MDNNQTTQQNNAQVTPNTTVPLDALATPVQPLQTAETPVNNVQANTVIQQPVQGVPNVEQSKEEFIDNTQALTPEKKENNKNGVNYVFMIILFVIIFAAIFFLFPILLKNL